MYVIKEKAWLRGGILLLLIVLSPVLAYHVSPSFKTRLQVSHWDFYQYLHSEELCDCSITLRLVVWESTLGVFLHEPLTGTGFADLKEDILNQYILSGVNIHTKGLLYNPHNQYLEQLGGAGLLGGGILFYVLFLPFFQRKKKLTLWFFCFLVMFIFALLTESLLERQRGVAFFLLFYLLLQQSAFKNVWHKD